jgi:hypothetical protein
MIKESLHWATVDEVHLHPLVDIDPGKGISGFPNNQNDEVFPLSRMIKENLHWARRTKST